MNDLLIKNGIIYIDGAWKKSNIGVKDEKIVYVGTEEPSAKECFDAQGLKVIPGLIDPHVHFSLDCGTIVSVDDFSSGTRSAAYGGVTTIIDFLDPARNAKTLEKLFYERLQLAKYSHVDYHLHGCVKEPDGDLEEFVLKMKSLGMNTIKLFTTYSETRRRTYDRDIYNLLKLSKKHDFLVECHIEKDDLIKHDNAFLCTDIAKARPSECELIETLKLAGFVRETGGFLYMVHCSSGKTLQALIDQYSDILGKNFFVESCPQYFLFNSSALSQPDGCLFTFAPPLRSKSEQELLIKNISHIDTIGTDHCSFNVADKKSHPLLAGHPFGIGGIETSFLLLHKLFGDQIIDKMSKNTAKIQHLSQKGIISLGKDADLVFLKEVPPYKIGKPHGNADYSIYENLEVSEIVHATMLRGRFILKDGVFIPAKGELINCD
ncbi:MAG TPA: amidohydrolase family protein [Bacilli bacterium]|nr:amidohydrolase family protein [Bacilli bacterium]HPS18971.1 amidohydrolase family protein [Bacilli bacterium]